MSGTWNVAQRMDEIRRVFLQSREMATETAELDLLIEKLKLISADYIPVAFEGAAMELALIDLSKSNDLLRWKSLSSKCESYLVPHAHVGLGWAIVFSKCALPAIENLIEPAGMPYIFDGVGHFHATLNQRQAVMNKMIPSNLSEKYLSYYDQGLGRGIWYIAHGQSSRAIELVRSFPIDRQKDLWRGIGIACQFVGGTSVADVELLSESSGDFSQHFTDGMARAIYVGKLFRLNPDRQEPIGECLPQEVNP